MTFNASQKRREDVEASMKEVLELLDGYERKRRFSDDPKEKLSCEEKIVELRGEMAIYESDLTALSQKASSSKTRLAKESEGPSKEPDLPSAEEIFLRNRAPRPATDVTFEVDDFYLERGLDVEVAERASRLGETLTIKGPRQMGKTGLLFHYLAKCQEVGKRIALLEFKILAEVELKDYHSLLSGIASSMLRALRVETKIPPRIERQMDLTNFIEDVVLKSISVPVVFAFDDVDRIMGQPFQGAFFTMLRMWHNKRAEPDSAWRNVDLALVISTEPYFLIEVADTSPFNVTIPVEVGPFSRENTNEMNDRYGKPLDQSEFNKLHNLLDGHPYLTRLAFEQLVSPGMISFSVLIERAMDEDGPFSVHLKEHLTKLHLQPELLEAMRQIVHNKISPNSETFYRLHALGLVRRDKDRVSPSNSLYAKFFKSVL